MISVSWLVTQVDDIEESFDIINSRTKPLAAYLFTTNKKLEDKFVKEVSAGAMCVNETALHVIPQPFPQIICAQQTPK